MVVMYITDVEKTNSLCLVLTKKIKHSWKKVHCIFYTLLVCNLLKKAINKTCFNGIKNSVYCNSWISFAHINADRAASISWFHQFCQNDINDNNVMSFFLKSTIMTMVPKYLQTIIEIILVIVVSSFYPDIINHKYNCFNCMSIPTTKGYVNALTIEAFRAGIKSQISGTDKKMGSFDILK